MVIRVRKNIYNICTRAKPVYAFSQLSHLKR